MNASTTAPSLAAQIASLPNLAMKDLWVVWDKYFPQRPPHNNRAYVEGRVAYKGSVLSIIHQLIGGIRSSMGYCGCASIEDLRTRAQFVEITSAGMRESHVHDVQITKEAPNYHVD